jgi:hypothetical protein
MVTKMGRFRHPQIFHSGVCHTLLQAPSAVLSWADLTTRGPIWPVFWGRLGHIGSSGW